MLSQHTLLCNNSFQGLWAFSTCSGHACVLCDDCHVHKLAFSDYICLFQIERQNNSNVADNCVWCVAVFLFAWIHTFAHVANSINQASINLAKHMIHTCAHALLVYSCCLVMSALVMSDLGQQGLRTFVPSTLFVLQPSF